MDQLFVHFDDDHNGILDKDEMFELVKFLVEANRVIHHDLHLRKIDNAALAVLSNCDWDQFHMLGVEDENAAAASGFGRLFLKQLKQQESAAGQGIEKRIPGALRLLQSSPSVSKPLVISNADRERDDMSEQLIKHGETMINRGVFALPRLPWSAEESAHPDEKRLLDMIGFLLDAYHREAWWWEVFEMQRKLMLAGAIILIPTEGGKQIAFAVLISTICLYVSLRTNPL